VEAIAHLTRGLEVLQTLTDTLERTQQELVLLTTLGPALLATKGWAAPEVGKVYARAQELCQQVGETPQIFATLYGLCYFHMIRAEFHRAQELAEQLLRMAHRMQKAEFVHRVATRMHADDTTAQAWVDAMLETLYETFKAGKGLTLPGLGAFIWNVGETAGRSRSIQARNDGRCSGGPRHTRGSCSA
jgi:nucleoid DNA-binding protein